MEEVKKIGSFGLYYPEPAFILDFNARLPRRFFKRRFQRFASVEYSCKPRGPRKFATAAVFDPKAASHYCTASDALAMVCLRGLEFQDAQKLCEEQKSFPILDIPDCERIWFCGTSVFQRNYSRGYGSSCVSYYPALVRHTCASRAGYTKWNLVWEYAFDESELWEAFDIYKDRMAVVRL